MIEGGVHNGTVDDSAARLERTCDARTITRYWGVGTQGVFMWSLRSRSSSLIELVAPLLDTIFVDIVGKLNNLDQSQFIRNLRQESNVDSVNEQDISGNSIGWRDKRIDGFAFSVDFGFQPWGLSVTADGVCKESSFVGLMLTVTGKEPGTTQEKCVSVEDYISVKATPAAKRLAQLLRSKYGYRYLD